MMFDGSGGRIHDHSGAKVSLLGTNISGITDKTGNWKLQNVPAGTYTFLFSKSEFDTTKVFGFQFNGMGDAKLEQMPQLVQPAVGTISNLSITQVITRNNDSGNSIKYSATISNTTKSYHLISLSKTENSSWNYDNNTVLIEESVYSEGNQIGLKGLQSKFPSGSTVYVQARLMNEYGIYFDINNKRVATGLGAPSNTTSFVMP